MEEKVTQLTDLRWTVVEYLLMFVNFEIPNFHQETKFHK